MRERIADYLQMGVAYVWVLDPQSNCACAYADTAAEGFRVVQGSVLRTENPVLELPLDEIFSY